MLGTATSVVSATPLVTSPIHSDPKVSLARSRTDLLGAFQLLYQSYLKAGLEAEKPSGIRVTPYHLLPTTEVVVTKLGDEVVSTVSLVGDGYLGVPMQSMYPQEINGLRKRGLRIAEVGCLADRRDAPIRFIDNFRTMTRLLAQVASVRGIDALVAATHPRHARFYTRALGFEQFGEVSECPYAQGNPAVALLMHIDAHQGTELYDRYYREPIPHKELSPYHWDGATRAYFKRILQRDRQIVSAACVAGGLTAASISGVLSS